MSDSSKQSTGDLDNYECQLCKKTFKYDSHYKRHLQTHTDTRPFECEICGKKFKRQDALKTHALMHSDNLPFKCNFDGCQECFASKAALRYHELRHQNQTVYICDIDNCGKKFITIGQLNQHQRTRIHQKKQKQIPFNNDSDLSSVNNQQETLNTENDIDQNQQFCNTSDPTSQQLINFQQFYEFQNDQNTLKCDSNLMQNMPIYQQPEIMINQNFNIKQEESFLDAFSNNEQEIINQIWNNTKKEEPADYQKQNKADCDQKFQESCNNGYCDDYPTIKRRKNSNSNSVQSSSTSNILQEFIRLNQSGYSFSRLKQELKVIVGLIDKIKKEDEEIESQLDNRQFKKQGINGNQFMDKMNINTRNDQNYYFYQNDENPFHNYECKYIHEYLPNDVLGNFDNSNQHQYMNINGQSFKNNSLQKNKISTAVRILHYNKKSFSEQKKSQMNQRQQEQTNVQQPNLLQMIRKNSFYNNTQTGQTNFYPVEQQQQQQNIEFNFENNLNGQQTQQFRFVNYQNGDKNPIIFNNTNQIQNTPVPDVFNNALPNIFEFPVFNYNPQQNLLNQFNQIQNLNTQVTTNLQPMSLQRGFSYQLNTNIQTPSNNSSNINKNQFNLGMSQEIYQQTAPQFNNIFDQDEQENISQFHSNETEFQSDNTRNIFDDADEPMNQIFNEDFFQMNQFIPDQQLNHFGFYNQTFQV